jgi:hypothetical protein
VIPPTGIPPETLSRRKSTETTEMSGRKEEEGAGATLPPPHYSCSMLAKHGRDTLNIKGWIGDTSCLVTTDTKSLVMIASLDINNHHTWMNLTLSGPAL